MRCGAGADWLSPRRIELCDTPHMFRRRRSGGAVDVGRDTRRSWWFVVIAAATAVFGIVFVVRSQAPQGVRSHSSLFDDAMISMRYARNLAHGHGLVWNVGESPIEGFSNPLWT